MKKFIKYALICAMTLPVVTSCHMLDEDTFGAATVEDMLQNEENVVSLVGQAYADLRFMHDFNSSKLGGKFCRIAQKAFSNIDDYYLTLGERVDIFLEEEYGKHPPKVMEATPEDEPVEDNKPV